jgi:hypothetical protein
MPAVIDIHARHARSRASRGVGVGIGSLFGVVACSGAMMASAQAADLSRTQPPAAIKTPPAATCLKR